MSGESKVLLTTDVLSRGINIVTVGLVINYEIPYAYGSASKATVSPISYVHRTGRAGRTLSVEGFWLRRQGSGAWLLGD